MVNINERLAELGTRYLQRSGEEVLQLRQYAQQYSQQYSTGQYSTGELNTLKEIEVVAHRIRGSGAMFGFAILSDLAGELEMLAVDGEEAAPGDASLSARMLALVDSLEIAVRDAQQQRS